jgi:hypothetical protein
MGIDLNGFNGILSCRFYYWSNASPLFFLQFIGSMKLVYHFGG